MDKNHGGTEFSLIANFGFAVHRNRARSPAFFIRITMLKLHAQTTKIWSAVTRHRFHGFGDLSPKQSQVRQPRDEVERSSCIRRRQVACEKKRGQVRALQSLP